MQIYFITIQNFRGISSGTLYLDGHAVLVGDNNTGKSTILEAIDLVLGPERLFRKPVIDEHDFFAGEYLDAENAPKEISIEIIIGNLSEEQLSHFQDHIQWWDRVNNRLIEEPPLASIDPLTIIPILKVKFIGCYDPEEDDFTGETFYCSPPALEGGDLVKFGQKDKRLCGFLILRTLRTGSRALSLERGSLLDIILRLKELRPQMWESVLKQLRELDIIESEGAPIGSILSSIQTALNSYIAKDWGQNPHMRVTDLTRENLRKVLTVFIGTGVSNSQGKEYAAPFHHQGTGTVNALVLAMLSMIANLKQNVIFAMEEPEIAIPPHTQRRIINLIRAQSAQAIFTSHSPYVLDEFDPKQILVLKRESGVISGLAADISHIVKKKNFRLEFRKKYSEALLARRVLIVEGRTELDAFSAISRKLNEIDGEKYLTLEAMGVAIIDAEGDNKIAPLASLLKKLGKQTYGIYDLQDLTQRALIETELDVACESTETSFEKLIVNQSNEVALRRFAAKLIADGEWPIHTPAPEAGASLEDFKHTMRKYFEYMKASGAAADFLCSCEENELPRYVLDSVIAIQKNIFPPKDEVEERVIDDNELDH